MYFSSCAGVTCPSAWITLSLSKLPDAEILGDMKSLICAELLWFDAMRKSQHRSYKPPLGMLVMAKMYQTFFFTFTALSFESGRFVDTVFPEMAMPLPAVSAEAICSPVTLYSKSAPALAVKLSPTVASPTLSVSLQLLMLSPATAFPSLKCTGFAAEPASGIASCLAARAV